MIVIAMMLGIAGASILAADGLPQRIVSLGPDMTEQLFLLGEEGRLVGCTSYCVHPPAAKDIARVASAVEVNLEKVIGLRPDVVLTTPLTPRRYGEALKEFGIRVLLFPLPKNFGDLCESFVRLAELVGKEEVARKMVDEAGLRVERLSKKIAGRPRRNIRA